MSVIKLYFMYMYTACYIRTKVFLNDNIQFTEQKGDLQISNNSQKLKLLPTFQQRWSGI